LPFLEDREKPVPEVLALKVAHVPLAYHVPLEMIQPFGTPSMSTSRWPRPSNGFPGTLVAVGEIVVVVAVGLGRLRRCFGR
jgi:hypothetical protein